MKELPVDLQERIRSFRTALPADRREEFIMLVLDTAEELAVTMYREMQTERKRVIDANLRTLLR